MATRQNLVLWSEDLSQAGSWGKNTGVAITANTGDVTDPLGTNTASKVVYDGSGTAGAWRFYQGLGAGKNATFTVSFWGCTASGTKNLKVYDNIDFTSPTTVTLTTVWQRFSVTFPIPTNSSGSLALQFAIYDALGANAAFTVYVWGAQVVQANYAGPYVKTTTAAVDTGPLRSTAATSGPSPTGTTQNLFRYSEAFDNAVWSKYQATISADTADTTDPLGTNTADALVENTANDAHGVYQNIAVTLGAIYTSSVYVKAGTRGWGILDCNNSGSYTYFNLSSGALGTQSGVLSSTVQALPNGWWRLSITWRATSSTTNEQFYAATGNGGVSYAGVAAAKALYFWGAQLEPGYVATPYRPTDATSREPNPRSRIATRQNLLRYSEQLDNAVWSKHACSITADATTAPDGTSTADAIVEDGTTDYHYVLQSLVTAIPTDKRAGVSVWVKAAGRNFATIQLLSTALNLGVNLTTGATTAAPAGTIVTAYPDAWWRVFLTRETGVSSVVVYAASTLTTDPTYAGTNALAAIYVWGAQTVQCNCPGPYVKTTSQPFNEGVIRGRATGRLAASGRLTP